MNDIRPDGAVSIRQFATICDLGEGHVRALLGDGKLDSLKIGQRRWIPISVVVQRYAEQLVTDSTRAAVLERLQRNAAFARVDIGTDHELVQWAEAYLRGENPRTNTPDPWATPALVAERELVEVGAD